MLNENRFLTVEDLAKILKLSPGRVRSRLSQNCSMPKSIRFGRRRLFSTVDVQIWLEEKMDDNS